MYEYSRNSFTVAECVYILSLKITCQQPKGLQQQQQQKQQQQQHDFVVLQNCTSK